MSFGIENPHEGSHAPGSACPACMVGYPKPCAPPATADRVVVGKVSKRELERVQAALAVRCPGYLHGEMVDGQMHQRCDICGIPMIDASDGRERMVIHAADVVVVPAKDLLP